MPRSFFKSIQSKKPKGVCWQQAKNSVNVPQGQLKNNEPDVPEVPDVWDVTTNQQWLWHRGMNICNITGTPLDLHQPQRKVCPSPPNLQNINQVKYVLDLLIWIKCCQDFYDPTGGSHLYHLELKKNWLTKIVTTALKDLGNVVGSVSEQNKSFDHEEYIRQLGDKAKALHESCLKKHKIYKKQFYVSKSKM